MYIVLVVGTSRPTIRVTMMSEQEFGKKMVEGMDADLFFEAYEEATGEALGLIQGSERPDFICERPDGTAVGLELTKVMRSPLAAWWDRIQYEREFRDISDTCLAITEAAECKSIKLAAEPWRHRDNTILVLQVMDCPFPDLHGYLADALSPTDFGNMGFVEVWAADYSDLDMYGTVELFGLYPESAWGYRERDRGKPYG